MTLSLLALLALSSLPPQLTAAVEGSLAVPSARVEVLELEGALPAGCTLSRVELPRGVAASGRVAVRLLGAGARAGGCEEWAWVRVRVTAPALVTTREVAEGGALDGAVRTEEREVLAGRAPLERLPEGASAARPLAAGTPLDDGALRVGPRPGEPVTVLLRSGALSVEQQARALPCRRGRACALLPGGKRLEGGWHGGRIEVELP